MKILLVGEYQWFWYEKAIEKGFLSLGHQVNSFKIVDYFKIFKKNHIEPIFISKYKEIQYRLKFGLTVKKINKDLINKVISFQPDLIFFYRPVHIYKKTYDLLKEKSNSVLISYFNDDPFSEKSSYLKWRHFINSIGRFDINYIARYKNCKEYEKFNSNRTIYLGHFYVRDIHYKNVNDKKERDVIFAGHYENDFRVDCIESILSNGIDFSLYGGGWNNFIKKSENNLLLRKFYPVHPVIGNEYRDKIAQAKIALCFLSKLNNDDSTSRSFEIPAIGTFMLSEYSDLLANIFKEGEEVEFFRSSGELLDKVKFYLKNDEAREKVAMKGFEKVINGKFSSYDKVKQILDDLETNFKNKIIAG
jgi:spore maturation protein CgeB